MFRLLVLAVMLALVGCGAPAATAPTAAPTESLPTLEPTPPSTAVAEPGLEVVDTPTTEAAEPTTEAAGFDSEQERGYAVVAFVQAGVVMLEDAARKVQAGELKGFEGLSHMIAIGAVLKAADEALAQEPPVSALASTWPEVRAINTKARDIFGRWYDDKIGAAGVLTELPSLQSDLDRVLERVDADLSAEYGVSKERLQEVREEAMANLRATLQVTPTPQP